MHENATQINHFYVVSKFARLQSDKKTGKTRLLDSFFLSSYQRSFNEYEHLSPDSDILGIRSKQTNSWKTFPVIAGIDILTTKVQVKCYGRIPSSYLPL